MNIADRATLERESRSFDSTFEFRDDDADTITFTGIASSVDAPYTVRDSFGEYTETMAPGAFKKTLKEKDDVRLLINHDGIPLARTKSKTLRLSADPHLSAEATLDPASPLVQTIRSAMARGDMDQMSIGMRVHRQEWNEDYTQRHIKEAQLFDVSLVTYPANPATSAQLRSLDEAIRELTANKDDLDEDEVRRVIAHLETLIRKTEPEFDPLPLMRMQLELQAKKQAA
jgi:hypothetical protein